MANNFRFETLDDVTIVKTEPFDQGTCDTNDSSTIVKTELFDQDMCDTNESSLYCITESSGSDCSSSQLVECKMENPTGNIRLYKCEQCGHMNTIVPNSEDGFFDSSQSIEISQVASSTFQVSIDPESLQLKNFPVSSQAADVASRNDVYSAKKRKRLSYPGDVGDDEELEEETAQKYISLLRKNVMEQRKQTRTLVQQNRRQQQRINRLKTLLKELIEKTKNGNYIIEAPQPSQTN